MLLRSRASLPPTHKRGLGGGPGSLTGPQRWKRRVLLLCMAPAEGVEAGPRLSGQAGLSEGKAATWTYPALVLGPSLCRKRFSDAVRRSAPQSGGGGYLSVLRLSSRSNNCVLVSQINLASPSPRGWLPFLQLASRHRIITAEPSEAALNCPKSHGASRSGDCVLRQVGPYHYLRMRLSGRACQDWFAAHCTR